MLDRCLSVLSCLSVTLVHCGQTVGRIKMKLGKQVGLRLDHIVLDGDSAHPFSKGHSPPNFWRIFVASNGCMNQDVTWYGDRRLGPGDFVLDGDPAPLLQKGAQPPLQFSVHFYCGQTAGWMKTLLGTEVYFGLGYTVLDGVPAPAKGAQYPPLFGPCLL